VFAVGAEFFATDINDDPIATLVTVTLGDGTVESFTPTSFATAFRGFVSDQPITSLVISGPGPSLYAGLDNLTVGGVNTVAEPAGLSLVALMLAGLFASRRRNA
jgi:MYXO-CTERM domain-containing protein